MNIQKFNEIPGLFLFSDYFSTTQCQGIIKDTLGLYEHLENAVAGQQVQTAHIPQPAFVRSAQHNLSSEEAFVKVMLESSQQRKLRCEYFPRYGEDGHALAYFRGNNNLPAFIGEEVLSHLHQTMDKVGITTPEKKMQWKLTINYYKSIGNSVAGFPFHVDIPANGVVTMILNVQREAQFQIAKDDTVKELMLPVGGLLVLSGESRYVWKHRVLPMELANTTTSHTIERVSLVLGFQ